MCRSPYENVTYRFVLTSSAEHSIVNILIILEKNISKNLCYNKDYYYFIHLLHETTMVEFVPKTFFHSHTVRRVLVMKQSEYVSNTSNFADYPFRYSHCKFSQVYWSEFHSVYIYIYIYIYIYELSNATMYVCIYCNRQEPVHTPSNLSLSCLLCGEIVGAKQTELSTIKSQRTILIW